VEGDGEGVWRGVSSIASYRERWYRRISSKLVWLARKQGSKAI
jgi:hypothetical protein